MKRCFWAALFLPWISAAIQGYDARFYAVEAQVQISRSPAALIFSWVPVEYARSYTIRRKLPSDQSWTSTVASLPGNASGFTDANIQTGLVYEYEIVRETTGSASEGGFINAYAYFAAGVDVEEKHSRGRAILIVDRTVAPSLTPDLEVFRQDLIGAGWSVVQKEVSRNAAVTDVKKLIRDEYNAAPTTVRSVILIGHVPVPYSGNIAPDMHPSHYGAWPADAYYGDMDGVWTDNTVSVRGKDYLENDNFPGDGKFDQSALPSPVELEVGRIDLWEMSEFSGKSEVDLLKNYFRKDHAFRHRLFTAPRQGLVRDNFGDLDGDAPAVDAWRHYSGFFGLNRVTEVGPDDFFPALARDGYLWAYACGGGGNEKADGVGITQDFTTNDPRAVFMMLHGSYFGDWNYPNNFLRAAIASPSFTLASIWTGLPHWSFHHMALGETLGYSTRISQNNLNLYKSYRNFSPAEVHISLIGDPTLEMFPVRPPSSFHASVDGNVQLRWSASLDDNIIGYHLYHSTSALGPYSRLTAQPVTSTTYAHSIGVGVHYYMVRAVKLEQTGSGTYRNLSQGLFTSVSKSSGGISNPPNISVTVEDGDAVEFRANSGSFKISRDVVDGTTLTVAFTLSGAALNGIDYLQAPGAVTFDAWSSSTLVSIYPRTDDLVEGDESVVLQLSNGTGYRVGSPATASFVIRDSNTAPLNTAPTISSIPDQILEAGTSREVPFSINDAETPVSNLNVQAASSNQQLMPNAGLRLSGSNSSRTLVLSPNSGTSGTAQVSVTVSDGVMQTVRTFSVTVPAPQNVAPQAFPQQVEVTEDVSEPIVLSGHDSRSANLQFRIVTQPSRGTLSGTPPLLVYKPKLNANGPDQFTFVVNNGNLDSAPAQVSITIAPVNDAPVALDDSLLSTTTDLTVPATALLENDTDPDNDSLTLISVASKSQTGGTVSLAAGSITYRPATGFAGTDTFTYTVQDPAGLTATASVQVQVTVRPVIRSVVSSAQGMTVRFTGPAGKSVIIEGSSEARTWNILGSAKLDASGTASFLDAQITGIRVKFYRLEVAP